MTHLRNIFVVGLCCGVLLPISDAAARQVQSRSVTRMVPQTFTVIQNGQPVTMTRMVPVTMMESTIRRSSPAYGGSPGESSDVDEGEEDSAQSGIYAGMTPELKEQVKARLEQLWALPFDRAPSSILQEWSRESLAPYLPKDPKAPIDDMPPGPPVEDLLSDERFAGFTADIAQLVKTGRWKELSEKISFLNESHRRKLFRHVLTALSTPPQVDPLVAAEAAKNGREIDPNAIENQFLTIGEYFELLAVSPDRPLKNEDFAPAGALAQQVLGSGNSVRSFLELVRAEVAKPEDQRMMDNGGAARLLFYAGQLDASGEFLPDAATALEASDYNMMNFICEQLMAVYAKESKVATLEKVWEITQQIVSAEGIEDKDYQPALTRAVSLALRIRSELGQKWLTDSFTSNPQRGIRILSAIGGQSAKSMMVSGLNPNERRDLLKLQKDAVESLLRNAGDATSTWAYPLELMALGWLKESEITYRYDNSTSYGPGMRRDAYGNIYYFNQDEEPEDYYSRQSRPAFLKPIPTGELLEVRPDEKWLAFVSDSMRAKFDMVFAQLFLKVSEEEQALPYIESLAKSHPEICEDLVDEFLKIWTKNHDPNSDQSRSNSYMYMYGYESRAESIPLTRSKQQRNLTELSELIPRLKKIGTGEIKQELVAAAFLTCHSYAEVFQIADLERVFGNFDDIEPKIIGSLAQTMRSNLASVWREIQTQKDAKTKRNQQEIIAEVMRGYDVARAFTERGLSKHPEDWNLLLIRANLLLDRLGYETEQKRTSLYVQKHNEAMKAFQAAAAAYANVAPSLEQKEYSTDVYERWFYATLGASDLNLVDAKHQTDESQSSMIREAIEALPPEIADWHMSRFANLMFNRLSNCQPAVKQRYLKTGFEIVGDNPQARKAREVFDYYSDLVTEIRLEATIDGPVQVGTKPFGVYIDLAHTREIEREAGGFAKYLQNQNSGSSFAYNYGRPTEDYRDRFEEHVREKLADHFEVLSVTFQVPEVQSRQGKANGWRVTPYAFLLLKAKGPEVDRIPGMRLDLDFLDTSGYAVLPVETPPVSIDSTSVAKVARPWSNLTVTEILDERQADDGKLILEVKATANGLVPEFDQLFGKSDFGAFEINGEIVDDGVVVSQFDPAAAANVISSERSWIVTLKPKSDAAIELATEAPKEFHFLQPAIETTEVTLQRYDDADLKLAEQVVSLERKYAAPATSGLWTKILIGAGTLAVLLAMAIVVLLVKRRPVRSSIAVPENISPFALISMLRQVETGNGLNEKRRSELGDSIRKLESWYFTQSGQSEKDHPDLTRIAKTWLTPATLTTVAIQANGN